MRRRLWYDVSLNERLGSKVLGVKLVSVWSAAFRTVTVLEPSSSLMLRARANI